MSPVTGGAFEMAQKSSQIFLNDNLGVTSKKTGSTKAGQSPGLLEGGQGPPPPFSNTEQLRLCCFRTWCTETCQFSLLCPSVWKRAFLQTTPAPRTLPTSLHCTQQHHQLNSAQETLRCRLSDWGSTSLLGFSGFKLVTVSSGMVFTDFTSATVTSGMVFTPGGRPVAVPID